MVARNLVKTGGKLTEQFQDSPIGDKLLQVVQTGRDRIAAAMNYSP
jgi:hypothetical protein